MPHLSGAQLFVCLAVTFGLWPVAYLLLRLRTVPTTRARDLACHALAVLIALPIALGVAVSI
ncbi:hypothetical protein [Aurantiacibacter zhengii]|uniref:Uncharacterized protein n=1 Tax=Aurantiacibacter zhengii TaxID=2307003 RepID=A0A418NU03_9SPHN|nr:hypothetical protein [Aurantiacibacter zhengii]RIV87479.1 hypothetical protein D2V07_03775 [Aurantiacibacter zhengii]